MSHLNGDAIQIVRKRQKGEPIPSYSTAALLYGCTFGFRQAEKPQQDFTLLLHTTGKNRAERDLARYGNAIREMLKAYKSNPEIAEKLGITSGRVSAATCLSDELRELSDKRRAVSGQKGGRTAGEHSKIRFGRDKAQIIADIDAIGIHKTSKKWRMDSRTIWKFLEEDEQKAESSR